MRFSKRHYPILGHVGNIKSLFKFQEQGLTEAMTLGGDVKDFVKDCATHCQFICESKSIDFVSVPFFEKATTGKVFEKLTGLFTDIDPCDGILLYPKTRFSTIHAVSYMVFPEENKDELVAELNLYSEEGRVVVLYVQIKNNTIDWRSVVSTSIKSDKGGQSITKDRISQWFTNHIQTLFSVLTFKQFAEIETKEIGGVKYPKKTKIGKEKYLNESDFQVNVLDSKWFTETIRGKGFAVSGHFRLQPYGEGMSKKKLIYIDDFLKDGYTSRARIKLAEDN